MLYREKRIISGKYLEIEIYPISPQERKHSRKKKLKESRKEQKNLNDKNAKKKLRRLINNNFDNKDLALHLTFDEKHIPKTEEEAKKEEVNFLRRVKRYRKKHGLEELKYISVLEYVEGKPGDKRTKKRVHLHMVLSGMDRDEIEKLWGKGRANADRLQPDESGFEALARYISKDPKGKKRYSRSKNLKEPDISINDFKWSKRKVEEISRCPEDRDQFEKLYPGYTFTDCSVQVNEINAAHYIEIKMRGS